MMADGSYLPIAEIDIGDYVLATDPETGVSTAEPVIDVIVGYGTKHLVTLDTDLDPANGDLTATDEHPIYIVGRGWTDAVDIRVGDQVLAPDGTTSRVSRVVDHGPAVDQLVYNLTVAKRHTFTVQAGDTDVVTHNSARSCSIGRGGRQQRLKALADDDKQPRYVRGWIKNEMRGRTTKSGKKIRNIRSPRGFELAHRMGREARRGYDYSHSVLQTRSLHRLQHRMEGVLKKLSRLRF